MRRERERVINKILIFLARFWEENGHGPTNNDVAKACGLKGRSHARYYLLIMEDIGLVERIQKTRGWKQVEDRQSV